MFYVFSMVIISFTTVLLLAIYYYCTSTFGIWKKLNVPYVRPIPLFGNYFNVAFGKEHPVDTYNNIYRELAGHKYGGYFQMRTPYLMIRDPEMINDVLIKNFSYFCNRGIYTDYSSNPMTDQLFFMQNPQWKIMRGKLSPAFTPGKLKQMFDQVDACGREMMKNLDIQLKKSPNTALIDMRDILGKYTTEVIGSCVFGIQMNALNDNHSTFYLLGQTLFAPSIRYFIREISLMVSPVFLKIFRLNFFPPQATAFFCSVFKDALTYRINNNITKGDIFQHLVQARNDLVLNNDLAPDEKFTDMQIVANAFVMFAAGFETVSTTIAFCLHELALKKHIQDKVREEIKSKKPKYNGEINYEYLMELNYLDMVISETLRKYPVSFALFREANETYHVPNDSLVIEKGQKVMIPVFSLHYNPNYYSDPQEFNPERFSPEEKSKRPSGIYFPFGDGPRMCIAKRFAEMEMKLILVKLLSKYEVKPCEKTEIPIIFSSMSILVTPKNNNVWLKLNLISD